MTGAQPPTPDPSLALSLRDLEKECQRDRCREPAVDVVDGAFVCRWHRRATRMVQR